MSNSVEISFRVGTTDPATPLGFEAWMDDQCFVDLAHVQDFQHVKYQISDSDGEHQLKFVMKHKLPEHTQIDSTGQIIKDARILLEDVCFDGITLGHLIIEQAVYSHDFNGTGPATTEKFYGDIGCNGTVTLNFTTPIYLWLLENM